MDISSVNSKEPQSPLFPRLFEFKWVDMKASKLPPLPPDEDGPCVLYTVTVNNGIARTGWIPISITSPITAIPYRPHWPYILGQCCLIGDINPEIAKMRLKLILDTLSNYQDPFGFLREFIAPPFNDKFEMNYNHLMKWMSIMYPVVGSFGSRFKIPCDVVSESCGHLL